MSNMKTINLSRTEILFLLHALSMAEFRYSKKADLFQHQIDLILLPDSNLDLALKLVKQQLSICDLLREQLTNFIN